MKTIKTLAIALFAIAGLSLASCNKNAENEKAATDETIEATENAEDVVATGKVVRILDFNATWCGPCKQFAPIFEAAAVKYPNIKFESVDVDENPEMANQFGVESIPMVVLLDENDKVLDQSIDFIPAEEFEQLIEKYNK
ncbi:MAG: thioredoxin family protein [Muribaculaceae bacterium]|nr:thioredoxin family protein [Muribaculaceae bacterium]